MRKRKYTYEYCAGILAEKQYKTLTELRENDRSIYVAIKKYNYDLLEGLDRQCKPHGYWESKENCQMALGEGNYNTLLELREGNRLLYDMITKYGFQDLIADLDRKYKPKGYYTKEICEKIVEAYETLTDLIKYDRDVYQAILKNGWHYMLAGLERAGDKYHYCVYIITNDTLKQIWIGVSLNVKRRWQAHTSKKKTKSYELAIHPDSIFEQITDYVDANVALDYEEHLQTVYENDDKWDCLSKPGNRRLGRPGSGYYTD